jgi:glutamyl-tRNA(Gln) amidotransferase subunit D
MAKPGDKVSITTKDETIKGTLMPEDGNYAVLKLDSGYNIGILKKRIKDVKVLDAYKPRKEEESEHTHTPGLPLITILHTGGTIASKVDYETGGVIARFSPDELLAQFPELKNIVNIESRLIRNMFSEDMRFAHYNILAKEIDKEIKKGTKGIIITHGTDTLHYTAAALSFMVKPLPIPVILVGAQRSSDRGSSDAAMNVVCATVFMTQTKFAGVGVCMHNSMSDDKCVILPGTNCRKMHSTRRDAFKAVNHQPLALVDFASKSIKLMHDNHPKISDCKPAITLMDEKLKIGMCYSHPNMLSDEIKQYEDYDGVVVCGTGLGHLPVNEIDDDTKEHTKILKALTALIKKGVPVVVTSQTIFGTVNLDVYSTGRKMQEAGVLGNNTYITPEAAFIKLAWLLSNHRDHVATHWNQNICGELGTGDPNGVPW